MCRLPNGDIVVGGSFTQIGGVSANRIARFNPRTGEWSPLGSGLAWSGGNSADVYGVTACPQGDVIAVGFFDRAGGLPARSVAHWDGTAWSSLGTGAGPVGETIYAQAVACGPTGDVYIGGEFGSVGGYSVRNIARWDGAEWSRLGLGLEGGFGVQSLAVLTGGGLVAAGSFTNTGPTLLSDVAIWDGLVWSSLGSRYADGFLGVGTLVPLADGHLLAGGDRLFGPALDGGTPMRWLAVWNGTAWDRLGDDPPGRTVAATVLSDGWVVHATDRPHRLSRLNGMSWELLGSFNGSVNAIVELPGGDFLVGGRFTQVGGEQRPFLVRWSAPGCPGDFNCSGTRNTLDLFGFLNAYFSGSPAADLNGDGVSLGDLFEFLRRYLTPC